MTALVPATLTVLAKESSAKTGQRRPVPVQFNPTSLRLAHQQAPDRGGVTVNTQRRQFPSVLPATLTVELEFDTAEEQEFDQQTGRPRGYVDVRTRTANVRQFTEPPREKPSEAPPRVRFQWGSFIFTGIVKSVGEDLDYFAADGTPLGAKVTLSITEQNLDFENKALGAGARTDRGATNPGGAPDRRSTAPTASTRTPPTQDPPAGSTPGRSGTDTVERVEPAVEGESAQQLAARLGADPAAWRSVMNGLASPLDLPAGAPVEIGPDLGAVAGPGRAAGFAAGAVSVARELAQVLGDATGDTPATSGSPSTRSTDAAASIAETAGFALTAAGGLAAARAEVDVDRVARATASARGAFAVPPRDAPRAGGVDARAGTYGRDVPLRARVDVPDADGRRSLASGARPAEPPTVPGPSAPWERLPSAGRSSGRDSDEQRTRDARPRRLPGRPGGGCP